MSITRLTGEKPRELGNDRPSAVVLKELSRGRALLKDLFGGSLRDCLVPPWNRIGSGVIPHLHGAGFRALSTFGFMPPSSDTQREPSVAYHNAHVDIIDWKRTRQGHPPEKSARKVTEALQTARQRDLETIGILTHHLVHGAPAWNFLEALLPLIAAHDAAKWIAFDELAG